jgi:putative two-component system response regulator
MKKKILVVDDQMLTLKQLEAQLANKHEILLARTGKQAIELCKAEKPDLILLDVEMSDMNGFAVMEELRKDPRNTLTPVIFLTSNQDSAIELKALEMGARDYIRKPVNRSILMYRIDSYLQPARYQNNKNEIVSDLEDSIAVFFSELFENKSPYTKDHCAQTGAYTHILGTALLSRKTFGGALDEDDLEKICRAALFHDIGKIAVPDALFNKKGSLSAEEYEAVKKHTVLGAKALEKIYKNLPGHKHYEYAEAIALSHHERYNGTGYPNGLAGEAIPLSCRIVSLANVYASCRKDRSYRKAMSHAETTRLLQNGRGTQFDPKITDVFLEIEKQFNEASESFASSGQSA